MDDEMLRLSEDYPDQRHWGGQSNSGPSIDYSSAFPGSATGFAGAPLQANANAESALSVRRRSSKGPPFLIVLHTSDLDPVPNLSQPAIIVAKLNASVSPVNGQVKGAAIASY